MKVLDPVWVTKMKIKLEATLPIDEVLTSSLAQKWLIAKLAEANRPFKTISLGSGVRRIFTQTEFCPCCKKPF